jgi:hypothetical protein
MIRAEDDHARAKERLEEDKAYLERLEAALGEADLTPEERERAMQPARAFHAQLLEEVEAYERAPAAAGTVTEEIRDGLRQLSADEASVELWLRTPHPMLDGDVPQELIDAGEGDLVLELVEHMLSGAPA